MRKFLLLGLAIFAAYMGRRALKRNDEVLQLLWALTGMTAIAVTSNTPKARSTEARLNALVPVIFPNTGGAITGNVSVSGNHSVGGQVLAGGATGSATLEVNGNGHVTSGLQVDGNNVVGGQLLVNGATGSATVEVGGNAHYTGGMQVDGLMKLSTGAGMPQSAPSSCGSPAGLVTGSALTWANSATSTINSLRSAMISAGVIS